MSLFNAKTMGHFLIECWLEDQGMSAADIKKVDFINDDRIMVTDSHGEITVLECVSGAVNIVNHKSKTK